MSDKEFCFVILGNGRKGYLERTIASWEANLESKPKYQIIFDDSGNDKYRRWLKYAFGNRFEIVAVGDKPMGQPAAVQKIFDHIQTLDVDHVLSIEEDWMLFRPLNIEPIMDVLDKNPNIVQMRIPRTIWHWDSHDLDLKAGSLLGYHIGLPNTTHKINSLGNDSWYEWRGEFYFWSHNPAVFKKEYTNENYLNFNPNDHENEFGKYIYNKSDKNVAGWWSKNIYDGYITHIGIRDNALLKSLPQHLPNPCGDIKVGVVIPWREQPSRVDGFKKVVAWYKENLPDAKIYTADRAGEFWSMSGSRNDGVRMAEADGCDVVIINDADTIPQIEPLHESISAAFLDDLMHNPYTEYRAFTEQSIEQVEKGVSFKNVSYEVIPGACSGVNVFTPTAWWKIGGNDEKFKGWGFEDTAMRRVHEIVNKTSYVRHEGLVFAFYHKHQAKRGDINYENNRKLAAYYNRTSEPTRIMNLVQSTKLPF